MQKWEYLTVGPIKEARGGPDGYYPYLTRLTVEGQISEDLRGGDGVREADRLAVTIAQLGEQGWEMTGCGSVSDASTYTHHYLYFKRPK